MIPLLETQALTVQRGAKTLCQNLHWQVQAGEIWGILGPNGCGKTTLLQALAGIHTDIQGNIFILGQPLTRISIKKRAQQIGILFQDSQETFPLSLWEYCFAARFAHKNYFSIATNPQDTQIIRHALECVDLFQHKERLTNTLSGGELRRLRIATLLTQTPSLYLLDEPTNHLDIRHQISILKYLRTLIGQQTLAAIMTLHDVNYAQQFCSHILLIFPDGNLRQGRAEELLTTNNLSELYAHKMLAIRHNGKPLWQAKHD
jgi:iron complex transport system ATP-binding protein